MKSITPQLIASSFVLGAVLSSQVMAEDCSTSFYCYGNSRLPATNTRVVTTTDPSVTSVRVNRQPAPAAAQQQAALQRQRAIQQAAARQRALQAQRIAAARQRAQQQARAVAQRRAALQAQATQNNRPNSPNTTNRPSVLDARGGAVPTVNRNPTTPIRPVSSNYVPTPTRPVVANCSQMTSNLTQQIESVERLAVLQSRNGQRDRAKALFSQAENIRQRLKNLNCQVM